MTDTELLRTEVKNYIDKADNHLLRMIHAMLKADTEIDWWDDLGEEEKESIERGLDDMEKGNIISHEEVMKKHPQWFKKIQHQFNQ